MSNCVTSFGGWGLMGWDWIMGVDFPPAVLVIVSSDVWLFVSVCKCVALPPPTFLLHHVRTVLASS